MVWYHIPPGHAHCPTQSHAHKFLIRSYPQSVPAELLICRSNCSHISSWIQVRIIALNRFLGRRMIVCARVSQKRRKSSPKIRTQTIFVFLLRIIALPILRPTIHSSMCCSSFVNVALTCPLFLQIGSTLRNLGTHGSDKRKYNMWAWLWVGQWVWPVGKWSDITSETHIIFISRDIIRNVFLVFIQSLMHLSFSICTISRK